MTNQALLTKDSTRSQFTTSSFIENSSDLEKICLKDDRQFIIPGNHKQDQIQLFYQLPISEIGDANTERLVCEINRFSAELNEQLIMPTAFLNELKTSHGHMIIQIEHRHFGYFNDDCDSKKIAEKIRNFNTYLKIWIDIFTQHRS